MMKKILAILLIVLSVSSGAYAAGYLEFDENGTPYKWDSPIDYVLDGGDLGSVPKVGADSLVTQALDAWSVPSFPSATLSFNDVTSMSQPDINANNILSFVDFNGNSCPTPEFVIVYDDDGSIFADLFGAGSDGILGLASPSRFNENTKKITCGFALINGGAVGPVPNLQAIQYTMMHEFGHAQNFVHSQINTDLALDFDNANDEFIPLMFPFIPDSVSDAITGGLNGLKLDDQFSYLFLYNSPVIASSGRIRGKILDRKGEGLLGVNVVCRDTNNPDENAVSWISDAELDGEGEYICGNLPFGDYEVQIEPVEFAINAWAEGIPPFIPSEFFNGSRESFDSDSDSRTDKTAVTVNGTEDGIDIVINDNGHITSTQTISSVVDPQNVADLEYFIYVPRRATKATFRLEAASSSTDIDLYGRCNSSFSLATSTAGPIYDGGSDEQQAEFAGDSQFGSETVVLDGSSSPRLDNCEYHLVVFNWDTSESADFDLTVTLEGPQPELKVDFSPQVTAQDNGETVVSRMIVEAEDDQFTISSIRFTDVGTQSIADVSEARFYLDANSNGTVDSDDTEIGSTGNIDSASKTFTFSNLGIFVDEGEQASFLITYDLPSTASTNGLWFLLLGFVPFVFFGYPNRSSRVLMLSFLLIGLGRCSGSSNQPYDPQIEADDHIEAKAQGFGDGYSVQVGPPESVKDFFE